MFEEKFNIIDFDPQKATEEEFIELTEFYKIVRKDMWPEDTPKSLEQIKNRVMNHVDFVDITYWHVREKESNHLIGYGSAEVANREDNQHMMQFMIIVKPEYKRQGIATKLLKRILKIAEDNKRRLLMTFVDSFLPEGDIVMEKLGGKKGLNLEINQLNIADLDLEMIKNWIANAAERAGGFEIGYWDGPYPEDDIEGVVELYKMMNTAPTEDLDWEDQEWTVEQIREIEVVRDKRKDIRWTLYVRNIETKEFAGFTEVLWNGYQKELLEQGDTAVDPKFRGLGLGRWLKAAMVEKVIQDRPSVKFIRTGNAGSNEPMLKINHELGFKLYKNIFVWQVEADVVRAYLEGRD